MGDSMKLTIVTPEKDFYSGEITELNTENSQGKFGILKDHIAFITALVPTVTMFTEKDGKRKTAFTSNGLLEVKDNNLKIMCEACEWPEDIDVNRAEEARKRAEERMKEQNVKIDVERAEVALMRAINRIKAHKIKTK